MLFNICTHAANFLRGKDEVKFVTFETLSKKNEPCNLICRIQFKRPLAANQLMQKKMADMATEVSSLPSRVQLF